MCFLFSEVLFKNNRCMKTYRAFANRYGIIVVSLWRENNESNSHLLRKNINAP